jgi:ribosomal-protein-alanine N-acetyltransferase
LRINSKRADTVIRPMEAGDVERVYLINRASFTTDAWSREAFHREFKLPYSHKYVAEVEGKVVGYIIYWIIREEATVMSFAVDPSFREEGIGKTLLGKSLRLIGKKAESVVLDVRKSNVRAIRLYKSFGFTVVYEREKFYSDGENALFMKLYLDKIKANERDKGKEPEPPNQGRGHTQKSKRAG